MSETTWLVVGLGNPGPSYAGTRHNAGAMVVGRLATRADAKLKAHRRTHAEIAKARAGGMPAVLAVPRSFMNVSGGPTAALLKYFAVSPDRLLVVHDELDLPFGTVRLKLGGGDNGHNGLRSIRASIGSGDFCRLRVGIGRPPGRMDPAAYVLKPFSAVERRELEVVIDGAADAAEAVLAHGLTYAQNHFNG